MTTVVIDWKTENLQELINNTSDRAMRKFIFTAGEKIMKRHYIRSFKPAMRAIVKSGKGMAPNVGYYRRWKRRVYGVNHPLGILTGELYRGLDRIEPRITRTRGKEVRMEIKVTDPFYAELVHNGFTTNFGVRVASRPFLQVTLDKTKPTLLRNLNAMFDGVDLTRSEAEVMSTILSYR